MDSDEGGTVGTARTAESQADVVDEATLTAQLVEMKRQVGQVEQLLMLDPSEENFQLKNELQELIAAQEEALMLAKKTRLLGAQFAPGSAPSHGHGAVGADAAPASAAAVAVVTTTAPELADSVATTPQALGRSVFSVGDTCQAPFTIGGGRVQRLNAMVFALSSSASTTTTTTETCTVVCLTPTVEALVPCRFGSSCRHGRGRCRFSHGHEVRIDALTPYEPPDFGKLRLGDRCLARWNDGVWYQAEIARLDRSESSGDDAAPSFFVQDEQFTEGRTVLADAIMHMNVPSDAGDAESSDDGDDGVAAAIDGRRSMDQVRFMAVLFAERA